MSASGEPPIRPSVPPLFWSAAAVWVGIVGAEWVTWERVCGGKGGPLSLGFAVLGGCLAFGLLRRRSLFVLVAASLLAGLLSGLFFWSAWARGADAIEARTSTDWMGETTSDPAPSLFGAFSELTLAPQLSGGLISVSWPSKTPAPEAGTEVRFAGSFHPIGMDERGRRSHRDGVLGRINARVVEGSKPAKSLRGLVSGFRTRALERMFTIPNPGGGLLGGVVLGDQRRLADTQAQSDFRTTGLSHLIAISGGHLVVVAGLVAALLRKLKLRPLAVAVAVSGTLAAYVVLSGVQPSAIRAWLMATVMLLAQLSGRRGDGMSALSVAVMVALLLWPPSAFDLGLQLSVAAVAGLLMFARLFEVWFGFGVPAIAKAVVAPVALTLVAQMTTLPLTVGTFGMMSLISPAANVIEGPIVTAVLMLGLAGVFAGVVSPAFGHLLLLLGGKAGDLAAWIAGRLAQAPYAAVPLVANCGVLAAVCALGFASTWVIWPQPSRRTSRALWLATLALPLLLAVGPPARSGVSLTVLDVGQGDAILVRDGSHTMLVDGGPSPSALRAALSRQHVRRIDTLVVTHGHEDHYGGLEGLAGVIPVKQAYVSQGSFRAGGRWVAEVRKIAGNVDEIAPGQVLQVGEIRVTQVSPAGPVQDPNENNSCVVLLVEHKGFEALLTGDAEGDVLDDVTARGVVGDIDVLKVGHHGSADAVRPHDLGVLMPELALISVGADNRFGHPVRSTLRLLAAGGSRVIRTDLCGDITVRERGDALSLSTQKRL